MNALRRWSVRKWIVRVLPSNHPAGVVYRGPNDEVTLNFDLAWRGTAYEARAFVRMKRRDGIRAAVDGRMHPVRWAEEKGRLRRGTP